jgi:hypothetical protein
MASLKIMLIAILAFQVNLKSCGKQKNQEKTKAIYGLWKGTFTTDDGSTGEFYFSIKPNGKIFIENNFKGVQRLANGTWNLKDNLFTCNGTYFYGRRENIGTITNHTATLIDNKNLTQGVWVNEIPNNDNGTFELTKVN